MQDYLFLIQFARAYALATYKSRTLDDMKAAQAELAAILDEMELSSSCAGVGDCRLRRLTRPSIGRRSPTRASCSTAVQRVTCSICMWRSCRARDAIVGDEGKTRQGTQAILEWIKEATVGNQAVATPISVARDGDVESVTARVAGTFPGSPITLTFRFTVASGKIVRLAIA